MTDSKYDSAPPPSVKAAVFIIGTSFYFGVLLVEFGTVIKRPVREICALLLGLAIFGLLRSLYRGQNWARIVLFVLLGLSLLGLDAVLKREGFDFWRSIAQVFAQLVVVALLLLKPSRRWFSRQLPAAIRGEADSTDVNRMSDG